MAEPCTYALREQHAWRAHTSKGEAQAGQEPSRHALPFAPSSLPSVHFGYPSPALVSLSCSYFPLFFKFQLGAQTSKTATAAVRDAITSVIFALSPYAHDGPEPHRDLGHPRTWRSSTQITNEGTINLQRRKTPDRLPPGSRPGVTLTPDTVPQELLHESVGEQGGSSKGTFPPRGFLANTGCRNANRSVNSALLMVLSPIWGRTPWQRH